MADIQSVAGRGVEAALSFDDANSCSIRLGSADFVGAGTSTIPRNISEALSATTADEAAIVLIAWDDRVRGLFLIDEQLRPESMSALSACRKLDLDLAILTGDRPERAARWADALSVTVTGGMSPAGKMEHIHAAQARFGTTAMVGDGINDAPAIAASDVGITLGCGADVTRDSAGVCIMSDDLRRVPWAIELSQRTRRIVRQNLAWAFGYNTFGIALAATGSLNPAIAAGLMLVSSVIVIINSLRLGVDPEHSEDSSTVNQGVQDQNDSTSTPNSAFVGSSPTVAAVSIVESIE